MADAPSTDADERTDTRDARAARPDSSWWYWVAAVPIYYVVGTALGFVVGVAAFAFALTGVGAMGTGMGMHAPMGWGWGLGTFAVVVVVAVLAIAGILLSLLFPLAIYRDADAVAATRGEWEPDAVLYGLLGLAGVVAQPLQVPLAVYYLYRRHEATGVP